MVPEVEAVFVMTSRIHRIQVNRGTRDFYTSRSNVITIQDLVVFSDAWIGLFIGAVKDLLWKKYRYVRYVDDKSRIEHLHVRKERQQPGLRPRRAD